MSAPKLVPRTLALTHIHPFGENPIFPQNELFKYSLKHHKLDKFIWYQKGGVKNQPILLIKGLPIAL
jgi:hypothetical protein